MLFDTTFLIDYEREVKRNHPGPAHGFLSQHLNAPLYISIITEEAIGFLPRGLVPKQCRIRRGENLDTIPLSEILRVY